MNECNFIFHWLLTITVKNTYSYFLLPGLKGGFLDELDHFGKNCSAHSKIRPVFHIFIHKTTENGSAHYVVQNKAMITLQTFNLCYKKSFPAFVLIHFLFIVILKIY